MKIPHNLGSEHSIYNQWLVNYLRTDPKQWSPGRGDCGFQTHFNRRESGTRRAKTQSSPRSSPKRCWTCRGKTKALRFWRSPRIPFSWSRFRSRKCPPSSQTLCGKWNRRSPRESRISNGNRTGDSNCWWNWSCPFTGRRRSGGGSGPLSASWVRGRNTAAVPKIGTWSTSSHIGRDGIADWTRRNGFSRQPCNCPTVHASKIRSSRKGTLFGRSRKALISGSSSRTERGPRSRTLSPFPTWSSWERGPTISQPDSIFVDAHWCFLGSDSESRRYKSPVFGWSEISVPSSTPVRRWNSSCPDGWSYRRYRTI